MKSNKLTIMSLFENIVKTGEKLIINQFSWVRGIA